MIDFENAKLFKLTKHNDETGAAKKLMPVLIDGEHIIEAYQTIRDGVIFTNKRVIAINVEGLTGKKRDITTLPYKRIQAFSVETSGVIDLDSELQLYYSGLGRVSFEFSGGSKILEICKCISEHIL
ncbi:MAG: PH domain-containing protein [Ruminococcus sp.]|jgi:hypothetical protein|nr:PH domain-containing protein [Ruminococcus sp.]